MFRSVSLNLDEDYLNDVLNDEELSLISMSISCSEETAYTTATIRMKPCEPHERKFRRCVRRFMANEGYRPIDEILNDPKTRLIKLYNFPTAEGIVVVLDYQVKMKGRLM